MATEEMLNIGKLTPLPLDAIDGVVTNVGKQGPQRREATGVSGLDVSSAYLQSV